MGKRKDTRKHEAGAIPMRGTDSGDLIAILTVIDRALPPAPWNNNDFVLVNGRAPGCNATISANDPVHWAPFARIGNGHPKFDDASIATAEALVKLRNELPMIIGALRRSADTVIEVNVDRETEVEA